MTGYAELLPVAVEAIQRAANIMRSKAPGVITRKGDRDMASEVDYLIEREIRDFLSARTPSIGFWGEEGGVKGEGSDLTWVLDPVDGTANFVRGIPMCGTSLGLMSAGRPRVGVIALPFMTDAEFTAIEGAGAYLGSHRISVSSVGDLSEAVVGIGDYAVGTDADHKNRLRLAVTEHLAKNVQRVRMNGSAAIDLAWLASGKLDASVTLANHPWDVAAGIAIAREAGAIIMDLDGADHGLDSRATVVVSPGIKDHLLDILRVAAKSSSPAM